MSWKKSLAIETEKLDRLEKVLCAVFIGTMLLLFLRCVVERYSLFPWFKLPLGWDPINYIRHAKQVQKTGILSYLFSRGRFTLYLVALITLGSVFDVARVEIFLPVVLLVVYSLISFWIVYRASDSLWLGAASIFLTLFNIRGSKFLGLFHANMLALIFFLSFIYVLSRGEDYLGGYRDYLAITLFFLVPMTHPFTSVFIVATLPLISLLNYQKTREELSMVGNRVNQIMLSLVYSGLVLLLNYHHFFNITTGTVTRDLPILPDPWFHMVGISDYLFIFNNDMLSLVVIILCNIYLVIRYRDVPWLSYVSIFSLISLISPLIQLVAPLHIPPNRITLLNQYQILVPLSLYGIKEDLEGVRLKLEVTGDRFSLTNLTRIFSALVLVYLAWTSWGIYDLALQNDMIPWINQHQYEGLNSLAEYRKLHPNEDLVIVYNPESPGYYRIHNAYAYVIVGDSHFYLGRLEDAIELVPPEELDYLSPIDYDWAARLYYGGEDPLSEARNSEYTLALINGFALNSISRGNVIGENAAILRIGEGYR